MPALQQIARDALACERGRTIDQQRQHVEAVHPGARDDLVVILAARERHPVDHARLADQAVDLERKQHRAECGALLDEAVVATREHRLADRVAADPAQAKLFLERVGDRALAGSRKAHQRDDERVPAAPGAVSTSSSGRRPDARQLTTLARFSRCPWHGGMVHRPPEPDQPAPFRGRIGTFRPRKCGGDDVFG